MITAELHYFLEVANTLNFSRAAEKLGISQPSLSVAMQRLEHTVGVRLFIRHKKGVTLTPGGKELMKHSKKLLEYWDDVRLSAVGSHEAIQGTFILGCHSSLGLLMLSRFIPAFINQHEKLIIHFKHDLSAKITEQVINFNIDVGIVVNPIKHPDLIMIKLHDDEFAFWESANNKNLKDINLKKTSLICNPQLPQTQLLLRKIKKKGVNFYKMITTDNFEIIRDLVAHDAGVGLLPTTVATAIKSQKLLPLNNFPVHHDEIYLIVRPENKEVRAIQAIIAAIKNVLPITKRNI